MNGKVFVIILNWNGEEDTSECISSVRSLGYQGYRIVIVDNGSEEKSISAVKKSLLSGGDGDEYCLAEYSRKEAESGGREQDENRLVAAEANAAAVLIENGENLGFACGCNVGIRYALAAGADYVWLLNNDTVLENDSLGQLVGFLEENSEFVGATGQIRYFHDKSLVWNCGGNLTDFGTRKYDYPLQKISDVPQDGWKQVTFITGCAFLIRASFFNQEELLSEKFFFGEEDIEFCLRLKKGHKKIVCVYGSIIYHKVGASTGGLGAPINIGKVYIHILSRFINMKSFMSRPVWHIWRAFSLIYFVYMCKRRYHLKNTIVYGMLKKLVLESGKLDSVSREKFLEVMESGSLDSASI